MKKNIKKNIFAVCVFTLTIIGSIGTNYVHAINAPVDESNEALYSNGSSYCCDGTGGGCGAASC